MPMFSDATHADYTPDSPSKTTSQTTFDLTDPKIETAKQRILTHMTADHADSLALFLQNYCHLPSTQIPLPPKPNTLQLTDITPTHLIITHPSGRNLVPISPPLTSISEARTRLIEMHNASLSALNLSPLKVTKFVPPNKAWQWALHLLCLVLFATFPFYPARDFLPEANTFVSRLWSFGGLANWNATLVYYLKNWVFGVVFSAHLAEVAWFSRTKLRKYWVPRFSGLWWAWTGIVLLGGMAGFFRFDDMVREMERDAERKKAEEKH